VSRDEVAQAREIGVDPKSGKPMTVRMGRFGPFVQIGTKDDEEKPKFAGLRPGQKMDTITHEQALELFKLPRTLGATAAGEPIVTSIGRFGPYVKFGEKYVSLKDDDPYTVTLERALEVIRLKQEADANRIIQDFGVDNIQVLNGRYGPYISDKIKNARIPKERDPKTLTLEECRELLAAAPARGAGRFGRGKRGAAAQGKGKPAAAKSAAAADTPATATRAPKTAKARTKKAPAAPAPGGNGAEVAAAAKSAPVPKKTKAAKKTAAKPAKKKAASATRPA
jgi:DNA topoisomerase-1